MGRRKNSWFEPAHSYISCRCDWLQSRKEIDWRALTPFQATQYGTRLESDERWLPVSRAGQCAWDVCMLS